MKRAFFIIGSLGFLLFAALLLGRWQKSEAALPGTRNYQRIVSLAPSYTEVIEALGLSERLVGVTAHCRLKNKARIGTFAEANFEAILSLKPDLIVAVPHVMAHGILKRLAQEHIAIFAKQPDSLDEIKMINRELARILGVKHQGLELNRKLDQAIHEGKRLIAERLHTREDKRALVLISQGPLVVAGSNTYPAQILEALGLENAAKGKTSWPVWSMEAMLSIAPRIVIIAEGRAHLSAYEKLFSALGIAPHTIGMTLLCPKEPLLSSPSPLLIDDIHRLTALLRDAL